MMHFLDPSLDEDSEELPHIPPRRLEFAAEILKLFTPALGLVLFIAGLSSRYPWLSEMVDVKGCASAIPLLPVKAIHTPEHEFIPEPIPDSCFYRARPERVLLRAGFADHSDSNHMQVAVSLFAGCLLHLPFLCRFLICIHSGCGR